MLNKQELCTLEEKRKRSRLIFMYKIIHGLVDIKINDFLNFLLMPPVPEAAIGF